MITFLFAGHETTSGLLSFTFYYLLSNPATYAKAQQEVDDVVGRDCITAAHLTRLPYLCAVLRESLRLSPTVPAIALAAKEDTTLGGKYHVRANAPIIALSAAIHRDPHVYGNDADDFRPDRMLDDAFHRRNQQFPNCWKPFGNGMRGCIGRSFAWQQALLVVAMLLQSFDFSMSDPSYRLKIEQTLTIKPDGFCMRAQLRPHVGLTSLVRDLPLTTIVGTPSTPSAAEAVANTPTKTLIDIYYGSNTRTCEQLASRLASHAADHGFAAGVVGTLDSANGSLSRTNPVVLIAASYNGQPAGNAARFVDWTRTLRSDELAEVAFAVFGCGHRDWARTFLQVPKYLDRVLEERGGTRLAALGTSDISQDKVLDDFAAWEEDAFWPAMRKRYGVKGESEVNKAAEPALQVRVCIPGSSNLDNAQVVATNTLPSTGFSAKMHLEVACTLLPSHLCTFAHTSQKDMI
jgi:cytochrome P450/NADPH-cytochrome P450 reductase